ncbi:MAG: AtpZ/AtpI family protein [Cytophagales bacterium]|nr:AtpZ/AtpI family protein [Cytophagales bacterium]
MKYSGLAFQMLAVILVGLYGGIKLDKYLELQFPAFTLVFTLSGVVVSMLWVIKDVLRGK